MKKLSSILIIFLVSFLLIQVSTNILYASDNPEYDKALSVYQNESPAKALPLMKQSAENGTTGAMWMLALIYDYHLGETGINYSEGVAWLNKYIDQPTSDKSCGYSELALLYSLGGHGIEKNIPYAKYLLEKLVEAGWTGGGGTRYPKDELMKLVADQTLLSTKNDTDYQKAGKAFGKNRPKDALAPLKQSAEYKNPEAMELLGMMYRCGIGTKQDYTEASSWYRKAADLGSSYAMLNLAELYQNGKGVTQDAVISKDWYKKAVAAGNMEARKQFEKIMKKEPIDPASAIEIVSKLKFSKDGVPWGVVVNKFILKPKWEYYYNDKDGHVVKLRGYYEDKQKEKFTITIVYILGCKPDAGTEVKSYWIENIFSSVKDDAMKPGIPGWLAFELE